MWLTSGFGICLEGIGLPLPIAVRVEYSMGQVVNAGDLAHHLDFIGSFSSCSRAQILNVLPDSKSLKYTHKSLCRNFIF